jgi:hypothetical protein
MRRTRTLYAGLLAFALSVCPVMAMADAPTPPAPSTQTTTRGAAPSTDAERYAQLEAQSPEAASFEGGSSGVYIGISTGAAVVIVVVLLLVFL